MESHTTIVFIILCILLLDLVAGKFFLCCDGQTYPSFLMCDVNIVSNVWSGVNYVLIKSYSYYK